MRYRRTYSKRNADADDTNRVKRDRRPSSFLRRMACVPIVGSVLLVAGLAGCGGASQTGQTISGTGTSTPPPWTSAPLPACTPEPCATYMGMTLQVVSVEKNFQPSTNGFHFARVTVKYLDTSGEQHAFPSGELALRDAVGVWQSTGNWLVGDTPTGCIDPLTEPDEKLAPGATAGPYGICFKAGGDAAAPLLLSWEPSLLTHDTEMNNDCTKRNVPASLNPRPPGVVFTSNVENCRGFLIALS